MDKGGADMPEAPDTLKVAADQYGLNLDTAAAESRLNNVDTSTPFGGTVWTQGTDESGNPTWTQGLQLTDMGRGILDNAFSYGDLPEVLGGNALAGQLAQTESDAYNRSVELMTPQLKQQENALMQDLAQRGIPVGSEAWNSAMANYSQSRNAALTQAAQDAQQQALAQQAQLYAQSLGARQQAVSEKTDPYALMLNTLGSMKTNTAYGMDPTDYAGLVSALYGSQAQAAASEHNSNNSLFGDLLTTAITTIPKIP